ncbi:conserved hypothetical protein, partial [Ricinus communis]
MYNGDGIAVGWLGHPIFREREKEGRALFSRSRPYLGAFIAGPTHRKSSCHYGQFPKVLAKQTGFGKKLTLFVPVIQRSSTEMLQ